MRDKKRFELLKKHLKGKKVLDIGSCSHTHSYGLFSLIQGMSSKVIGIDLLPSKRKDVLQRNAEDFDIRKEHGLFDAVTCFGTLHQIANAGNALKCFNLHLKKGGLLFIGFPYVFAPKYRIMGNRLVDPSAVHWFCERTIKNLLTRYGFEIVEMQTENPVSNPELMVVARKV